MDRSKLERVANHPLSHREPVLFRASDASAASTARAGRRHRSRRRRDRVSHGLDVCARLPHRRQELRSIESGRFGGSTSCTTSRSSVAICRSCRSTRGSTTRAIGFSSTTRRVPFTFLLHASREVPKRLVHPKRRSIGIRVPDHVIAQGLLEALGEPMMSTSLILPDATEALTDPQEFRCRTRTARRSDHRRRIVWLHCDDRRRSHRGAAGGGASRTRRRSSDRRAAVRDPSGILPRSKF